MGGSSWDDDHYSRRVNDRAARGVDAFAYSHKAVSNRTTLKAHPDMEPNGISVRESRDSEAHPESVAIAVMFDVTGSMHRVPVELQKRLPSLMGTLVNKGFCKDPQVLFGAVGDSHTDRVPLQIGQFESGIEMDEDLGKIVLEGMGGGTNEEGYELALYFFARHTSIDCHEKRGKKGYLFLIGDEHPYKTVTKAMAKKVFGDDLQVDEVSIEDLIVECQRKYNVYFIIPGGTSHWGDPKLTDRWRGLLGQNVLELPDPNTVCDLIGATVGLMEGLVDQETATAAVSGAVLDAVVAPAGENVRL